MMIRALMFTAIVAVGSVGFYLGMNVGELAGVIKAEKGCAAKTKAWTAQATSYAFDNGFTNGVQCGLIAYTYAPEEDPARTDIPIMTLRARYWYTAIQATKAFLPEIKRPTPNAEHPTPNADLRIPHRAEDSEDH
jgi:hypothetical protein